LLDLLDRWGLAVQDRRVKAQLVEAVASNASYLPGKLPIAWPSVKIKKR
jgi:hypothetical protein